MNYFGNLTFVRDKNIPTTEFGRFIFEPVPVGSGRIFGNAIRRMMMFSVPGAAVLKLKFDEALHEFSTIPEVVEDVQEIIMNLKKVVFSLKEEKVTVRVEKTGPCKVYAKDIPSVNSLKVINPDEYIATINAGGTLNFELEVCLSDGYVTVDENQQYKENIGEIILDTNFTPVRKVGYNSEKVTDTDGNIYERLIMDVWADGSIETDAAMKEALSTLYQYTEIFGNFTEYVEEVKHEPEEIASIDKTALPVTELNLSVRSRNCLKYVAVKTVGDLAKYSAQELMEIKNFGKKSLVEIRQKLGELGLALKGEGIVDEVYDSFDDDDDSDEDME